MVKLKCIRKCWIPTNSKKPPFFDSYEDTEGEDVFEVTEKRAEVLLATGNFEQLKS